MHRSPNRARSLATVVAALFGLTADTALAQPDPNTVALAASVTGGAMGFYTDDTWGMVKTWVRNTYPTEQEVRVVWSFRNNPSSQFVKHVWVPGKSTRTVTWPARLVGQVAERTIEGEALLLESDAETGFGTIPGTVLVRDDEQLTSMIVDDDDDAANGVRIIRETMGLAGGMVTPLSTTARTPRSALGWEPIVVGVIALPELAMDSAQRRALRRWLHAGGTLWVMLDETSDSMIEHALGDAWPITVVDRVTYESVQFAGERTTEPIDTLEPFDMVRTIVPAGLSTLTANGWPALIERRIGAGRLVVTTIDPRAWLDERGEPARGAIARAVYGGGPTELDAATNERLAPYVETQIGYTVVGRTPVAALLIGYVVAFAGIGLVLHVKGRGDRIAPVGVVLAVLAGGSLLTVGMIERGDEEPIVSVLQVVHSEPGANVAAVRGSLGLYSPARRPAVLASADGGRAQLMRAGDSQEIWQMVWTDLNDWRWDRVTLADRALQRGDFATTACFDQPMELDASFGEQGLTASARWPVDEGPEDMLLLANGTATVVTIASDNEAGRRALTFADAALPADAFAGATVLNQTQRMRSNLLAAMSQTPDWPGRPMLVGWTPAIDDGLNTGIPMRRRGAALWLVPIEPQAAEPGQRVAVPWQWMPFELRRDIEGLDTISSYNPIAGQFVETSRSGVIALRFTPPPQVQPLAVERATLLLDIDAPRRTVELLAVGDGRPVVVASLGSPTGPRSIDVDVSKMNVDPSGAVTLALRINKAPGARPRDATATTWHLKRIGLSIAGTVQPRSPTGD